MRRHKSHFRRNIRRVQVLRLRDPRRITLVSTTDDVLVTRQVNLVSRRHRRGPPTGPLLIRDPGTVAEGLANMNALGMTHQPEGPSNRRIRGPSNLDPRRPATETEPYLPRQARARRRRVKAVRKPEELVLGDVPPVNSLFVCLFIVMLGMTTGSGTANLTFFQKDDDDDNKTRWLN